MKIEFFVEPPNHCPPSKRGDPPTETEKYFLERIAMMVAGTLEFSEKDSGYRWMLGGSNNWWMNRRPDGAFILAYRYSRGLAEDLEMQKLRDTLFWLFGIQELNERIAQQQSAAAPA